MKQKYLCMSIDESKFILIVVRLLFKDDVKFVNYERFYRIHSYGVNSDVYKYLKCFLCDLSIFVDGYSGDVFDLMDSGVLEGWCWQTTESCSLLLDDSSVISRGVLKMDYDYFHSWIEFYYNNNFYVFDPCLKFLCLKDDYYNNFNVVVSGSISSCDVKKYFIARFLERNRSDIYFSSSVEDVNSPMYRSGVLYIPTFCDGKIKKLVANYK